MADHFLHSNYIDLSSSIHLFPNGANDHNIIYKTQHFGDHPRAIPTTTIPQLLLDHDLTELHIMSHANPQEHQPSLLLSLPIEVLTMIVEDVVVYDRVLFLRIRPNSSRPGKTYSLSWSKAKTTDGSYTNLPPFDIDAPPVCKALHSLCMEVFLQRNTFGFRKIEHFDSFTYWLGLEKCQDLRAILVSDDFYRNEVAPLEHASQFLRKVDFPTKHLSDRDFMLRWDFGVGVVMRWKDKMTEIPYVKIGRTPNLTSFEIAISEYSFIMLYRRLRGYNGPWRQRPNALKASIDPNPGVSLAKGWEDRDDFPYVPGPIPYF